MSAEQFFENYPPSSKLREIFADNTTDSSKPWPRLSNFLGHLGGEGRDGIMSLSPQSGRSGVIDRDTEVDQRIWRDGAVDLGAIAIASLVPLIPEMIANQSFSLEGFIARFNLYLSDTPVGSVELGDEHKGEQEISRDKWGKIVSCAQSDKTMASFLRNPELLPGSLFILLEELELLPVIALVLDQYEERARIIIDQEDAQLSMV